MILYYYTTTQTMQFILTNSNMFATNMSYMNDSEEYVNGLSELYYILNDTDGIISKWKEKHQGNSKVDLLDFDKIKQVCTEKALKEYKEQCDSYSISFCKKRDLLSQWSMYAKESGVSLTMNFAQSSNLTYKGYERDASKTERAEIVENSASWKPQPVYYFTHNAEMENEQKQETAENILDKFFLELKDDTDIYECFEDQWKSFGTHIKRYDFYQENEHRIVFNLKDLRITPRIDYRNDKNVLKPYLDIECADGWPITEVTVGPGFNQSAVLRSLRHFLDNADVKCHILNEGDYWKRIADYMKMVPDIWNNNNGNYPEEIRQLRARANDKVKSKEEIFNRNEAYNMVQKTIKAILNAGDCISDEQKKPFKDNYFSASGIALRKSEIPYIF